LRFKEFDSRRRAPGYRRGRANDQGQAPASADHIARALYHRDTVRARPRWSSRWSHFLLRPPPETAQKEKFGDTLRSSIEKIVALKADLVIASTSSQLEQFVLYLDQVGVPIYVSNPRDLEGVLESITEIGEATGAAAAARDLVGRLRERIDSVASRLVRAERPRVFFILSNEPLITAGGGSFINGLITSAGGRSISAEVKADYPQYSLETAVAEKPEVIFFQSGEARLPDRLKQTPAGRADRVFHINDDLLLRPGPRIVDRFEQMAAYIHPELFRQRQ
jgi:iron complex transport system substrate-binding protein